MSNTDISIVEQYRVQGTGESIPYALTTTPYGSAPTSVTVTALDMTASAAAVTSTVFPAGTVDVTGDVITTKPLTALSAGHVYRIVFTFTSAGKTFTPFLTVYAQGYVALTNAYADHAHFKLMFMPPGVADALEDRRIGQLLSAVSRKIDQATRRRFYVATESRYYTAIVPDLVWIDDALAVTAVATDDAETQQYSTSWATTDYNLEPFNAPLESIPEPYTQIRQRRTGAYRFPVGIRKGVKVTGSFGYSAIANVPDLIREACLLQAGKWWKRKDAIFGVMGSPETGIVRIPAKLDDDVKEMIAGFIRHTGML